jgi:hypothetical protein
MRCTRDIRLDIELKKEITWDDVDYKMENKLIAQAMGRERRVSNYMRGRNEHMSR